MAQSRWPEILWAPGESSAWKLAAEARRGSGAGGGDAEFLAGIFGAPRVAAEFDKGNGPHDITATAVPHQRRSNPMTVGRLQSVLGRIFFQRCFYLFASIVALIAIAPYLADTGRGRVILPVMQMLMLVSAIASLGRTAVP